MPERVLFYTLVNIYSLPERVDIQKNLLAGAAYSANPEDGRDILMYRLSGLKRELCTKGKFGPRVLTAGLVAKAFPSAATCNYLNRVVISRLERDFGDWALQEAALLEHAAYGKIGKDPLIWVMWYQGYENAPPLVRHCIDSIRRNAGACEVVLLDENNLDAYCPDIGKMHERLRQGKISFQFFSDCVRMSALAAHGGCYMDATLYNAASPWGAMAGRELYTGKLPRSRWDYSIADNRWTGFFLACGKGCPLPVFVRDFFEEYFARYDVLIDYLLIDYAIELAYRSVPAVREMLDAVPQNNPRMGKLRHLLPLPYEETVWNELTRETCVFKLNHRDGCEYPKGSLGYRLFSEGKTETESEGV